MTVAQQPAVSSQQKASSTHHPQAKAIEEAADAADLKWLEDVGNLPAQAPLVNAAVKQPAAEQSRVGSFDLQQQRRQ